MAPALPTGDVWALTAALVDIASESFNEQEIVAVLEAELRACEHLTVDRIGDNFMTHLQCWNFQIQQPSSGSFSETHVKRTPVRGPRNRRNSSFKCFQPFAFFFGCIADKHNGRCCRAGNSGQSDCQPAIVR